MMHETLITSSLYPPSSVGMGSCDGNPPGWNPAGGIAAWVAAYLKSKLEKGVAWRIRGMDWPLSTKAKT